MIKGRQKPAHILAPITIYLSLVRWSWPFVGNVLLKFYQEMLTKASFFFFSFFNCSNQFLDQSFRLRNFFSIQVFDFTELGLAFCILTFSNVNFCIVIVICIFITYRHVRVCQKIGTLFINWPQFALHLLKRAFLL